MKVNQTKLPEVLLIEPKVFEDPRGFFLESYHSQRYLEFGIPATFVQDNVSFSERGVLRGLHFQNPNSQGKLVSVLMGEIFDVAVDIRKGSPRFGQWVGEILSSQNHKQLFIPAGFAHGFCVTSPTALVSYKCTDLYHPENEHSLLWNDPDVGVQWPLENITPSLSKKDLVGHKLKDLPLIPSYS